MKVLATTHVLSEVVEAIQLMLAMAFECRARIKTVRVDDLEMSRVCGCIRPLANRTVALRLLNLGEFREGLRQF